MPVTSTRNRLTVGTSTTIRMALELLAERNGLTVSSQAAMILRQGLDRTINSDEFRRRHQAYLRQRTTSAWQQDETEEYVLEKAYQDRQAQLSQQTVATDTSDNQ